MVIIDGIPHFQIYPYPKHVDVAHLQPGSLDELISPRQGLLFGNCGKDWDLGREESIGFTQFLDPEWNGWWFTPQEIQIAQFLALI